MYTPQPDYSSGDYLVYSVFDGVQESAEARFDFKFFAVNKLPIAAATVASVDEDSVLGVRIQLNGSDVDTKDPTFVITELPQKGTLFTMDGEPIIVAFSDAQVADCSRRRAVAASLSLASVARPTLACCRSRLGFRQCMHPQC